MKISQRIKIGWFCSTIWNCATIQQHSDSWLGRGNGNEWNGLEPRMVSDLSREYEDVVVILDFSLFERLSPLRNKWNQWKFRAQSWKVTVRTRHILNSYRIPNINTICPALLRRYVIEID